MFSVIWEKKYRKIYAAHYEFSPEVTLWIDKCHSFRRLVRERQGKGGNSGNLRRFSKRCGIPDPMSYSTHQLVMQYKICKSRSKCLMATSPWMRKVFLSSKLDEALANSKEEEAKAIRSILKGEVCHKSWANINRSMGKQELLPQRQWKSSGPGGKQ